MANCAGTGVCRCVHIYDDGTAVAGSGNATNPYVHERPAFTCVKDFNGDIISPDSAGCIQLPSYVECIADLAGNEITPDAAGCVNIGNATGMNDFRISDADGDFQIISQGNTITFRQDGSDGTINNIEKPEVVPVDTVIFPQMKTRTLLERDNSPGQRVLGDSNGDTLTIPSISFAREFTKNFSVYFNFGIAQTVSPGPAPVQSESFLFDAYLFDGSTQYLLLDNAQWLPDFGSGYMQFSGMRGITAIGPAPTANWRVQIVTVSNNLNPARNLHLRSLNIHVSFV